VRTNYDQGEIRVLVEEFEELECHVGTEPSRLSLLCRLLDIEGAITRLGPKEYQAVLLCGQLGVSTRTAGNLLGCSAATMHRRYERGLEMMTTDLNHTGGP
jgi:DNA-directed RNA polymerase specialized sigma24 family protein